LAVPWIEQIERMHRALLEGDRVAAASILRSHPEVVRSSIHAACGATDRAAVETWLAQDQALATSKHGGLGWTPLDCLAASPTFDLDDEHRQASVDIGRRLLDLGADPNTYTLFGDDPDARLSVLYRASQNGNASLVRLLLERGALPNDGESMYHAAERNHREVMELLLAHGAEISAPHPHWGNTVLYFLTGYREGQPMTKTANAGLEWLLEHGADPNVGSSDQNETPLHRIAEFGRAAGIAELLLAHGADPHLARSDGRTPYELAMRVGNREVAELLRARGAAVQQLRPEDALLAACAAGDIEAARTVAGAHPGLVTRMIEEDPAAIVRAAGDGSVRAIPALAAFGYDFATEGPWGGTALHWAAWHGRVELVRALIAAGSPINLRDRTYGSSPIAWAAHGSRNCRSADDDYATTVDLLLDAGSERLPSINQWDAPPEEFATDAVLARLRARGFSPAEA
jgi:ankyrin repeat protein